MESRKPFPLSTTLAQNPHTSFLDLPASSFDFPFFDEGVRQYLNGGHDVTFRVLNSNLEYDSLLPVKGFIFHCSHCGSTLLARMLNQKKNLRVVSEPEAINGLLLSKILFDLPENEILPHLEFIINSFCQKLDFEDGVVFKLTSWNVFFIRFFQKLYPSVPFLFLKREPQQVLSSLLKSEHGFQTWWDLPDQFLLKKFLPGLEFRDRQHFISLMVEKHIEIGEDAMQHSGMIVDYQNLISDFEKITSFFDLTLSPEERKSGLEITKFNSKKYPEMEVWE
ncbi:MAG: hypothetical protein R2879_18480 [Saprospiraceae bacterium]